MPISSFLLPNLLEHFFRQLAPQFIFMLLPVLLLVQAIQVCILILIMNIFYNGEAIIEFNYDFFVGFINVSCMAVMEFMTPKWRSLANMAGPMGEGFILLAVMGYFIRPWRMLYLASLWPYLLMIPIFL